MGWKMGLAVVLAIVTSEGYADDSRIPVQCRAYDARNKPRCEDIIYNRAKERNTQLNRRDAVSNAALKQRILASLTNSGNTVGAVLEYASDRIPFYVRGWYFVYARSGAEYVVMNYGSESIAKRPIAPNFVSALMMYFDYDLPDRPIPLQNSGAGYVVWKVDGNLAVPWGAYSNMLPLGPEAFVYWVNARRKGFDNSGYSESVANDLSFLSRINVGTGKLSDFANPRWSRIELYWNMVEGYVVQAEDGVCPPRKIGSFTIRGSNCDDFSDVFGSVLPFTIEQAFRNYAYKDKKVEAFVSLVVEGGQPGDWIATAVYVAERSIVRDVNFASVLVLQKDPEQELAQVYYAPDPSRSLKYKKWVILATNRAATRPDAEYKALLNELSEVHADWTKAKEAARRIIIRKYSLPQDWKPLEIFGVHGPSHDRDHIHIKEGVGIEGRMLALRDCLTKTGPSLRQGCIEPQGNQ